MSAVQCKKTINVYEKLCKIYLRYFSGCGDETKWLRRNFVRVMSDCDMLGNERTAMGTVGSERHFRWVQMPS